MFTEHPVVVLIALVVVPVLGLGVALASYLNDLGSNLESGGSGAPEVRQPAARRRRATPPVRLPLSR